MKARSVAIRLYITRDATIGMMKNIVSDVSRRRFLATAAGTGSAMLLSPAWLHAADTSPADTSPAGTSLAGASMAENDPRVAQILSRTIAIDMHNHVYPAGTEPHPQHGPQGNQPPRSQEQPQVPGLSLARELKQSGLTAVCAAFVLDFAQNNKPGDARNNFLHWLTAIDAELEQGHMHRSLNLKDLRAAHDRGQPAIVQSTEGSMFIEGHLDRVEEVYKRGLRHLQLLHEHDDMVSPLGDTSTSPAHLGGLTAFGAEVVKECNRLGIVVDLAHASHPTVLGALKVATQPVIVSHTSLDSRTAGDPKLLAMMKPHLISKEHAKVVADAGGVVGVWTKMADTLPDFVESIKSMVDAIGIDHVGIGTDTDLLSARDGQGTNKAYPGLNVGFFPSVVAEMLRQGFTPGEIDKVGGGNFCRVFDKVTTSHA
jgi:membrane dipeptidase